MPRPLKRRQREENARFLKALARTGNARLAALVLGVNRSTYTKRRAKHPAFAAAWDAALAAASPHRRRPRAGGITPETDAAFFAALAEGYSLRLAAFACGFAHSSFLARAAHDPAFAHEIQVHAAIGRDRLVIEQMNQVERGIDFTISDQPLPPTTVETLVHRLHLENPNGRFQAHLRRIRHPKPFSYYEPRIRAQLNAAMRRRHFEETGSWRMASDDDEG
jgi:hypothetical protein